MNTKESHRIVLNSLDEQRQKAANGLEFETAIVWGSNLYGLNTDESDLDVRCLHSFTDKRILLGFDSRIANSWATISYDLENRKIQLMSSEIRKFFDNLKNARSHVIDMLFAPDSAIILNVKDSFFNKLREHSSSLIDSHEFYEAINWHIFGEAGSLYEDNDFGYCPKKLTNIMRLHHRAKMFFLHDEVVVDLSPFPEFRESLLKIKNDPSILSYDEAEDIGYDAYRDVTAFYKERVTDRKFDEFVLEDILVQHYIERAF